MQEQSVAFASIIFTTLKNINNLGLWAENGRDPRTCALVRSHFFST
jgi:hypothetical protein